MNQVLRGAQHDKGMVIIVLKISGCGGREWFRKESQDLGCLSKKTQSFCLVMLKTSLSRYLGKASGYNT
jgi:hypothetical protein